MPDSKVYDVLPHAAGARTHRRSDVSGHVQAFDRGPGGVLGGHGGRARALVQEVGQGRGLTFDGNVGIRWFDGAKVNVAYKLPRPASRGARRQAGDPVGSRPAGRGAAHHLPGAARRVCKLANVLKSRGVEKGDRVCVYMPMVPEAAMAMLACARIGGRALRGVRRVLSGRAARPHPRFGLPVVITAAEGPRGGRNVPLKKTPTRPWRDCPNTHTCIVVAPHRQRGALARRARRLVPRGDGGRVRRLPGRGARRRGPAVHPLHLGLDRHPEGRAAQPGRIPALRHADLQVHLRLPRRRHLLCTADVGWITGHTYVTYAPLANGATTVLFEGVPKLPRTSAASWQICDKYGVNLFYTAPTAIRALMGQGDRLRQAHKPREPAHPRLGGRAHQPGGLGVVLPRGGRRALPDRRHLVADREPAGC